MKPFAFIPSTIFLFVCLTGAALSSGRGNVLFLFNDDQRAGTIHAPGNDLIETPNLDRLVIRGMGVHPRLLHGR
jgi:hypothetical protein